MCKCIVPCSYIADPLLVDGRKFHIRAYALCVGSLAAYVHDSPLALFAAAPYPQVKLHAAPQLHRASSLSHSSCVW